MMVDILSMASNLDEQIEKMDMNVARLNLFEPSEHKVMDLKLRDVIQSELELEDQLSAEGIVWLLEKNNRLAEQILLYAKVEENMLNRSSLSDADERMLEIIMMSRRASERVIKDIDKLIEKQEEGFDERHSNCVCMKANNDIMNYSRMNPGELKDIIEREGDEFWSKIGVSNMEDDKKELFLSWMDILSKKN